MKRILITGGFGFLGQRFVQHFQSRNLEVMVLEHPNTLKPRNFPDCEVYRADITSEASLNQIDIKAVDAVLHLAAQSSGPRSFTIPVQDVNINILGTLNTINFCLRNQIERLLFASSFVIYGDHPERETLDEETPFRPKSVYASSKLACEHLLMNYAEPKGLKWNALRLFNVYGQGQDITKPDQGVAGIFMNMLLQGDVIQIKGSLDRFRDLISIDDVIRGWDLCLHGTAYNQSFNLGTGKKTTYLELIQTLARILKKEDRLVIDELPGTPGDMKGCVADISKIHSLLDFIPNVALEDGLHLMLDWVKQGVLV